MRNRIKNCDKMGGLRERPLCLSTPHTSCIASSLSCQSSRLSLPQHTSYELHLAAAVNRYATDGFASAHLIRAASWGAIRLQASCRTLPQHTSYELHPRTGVIGRPCWIFASAHLIRAASVLVQVAFKLRPLCLSTPHTSCIKWQRYR